MTQSLLDRGEAWRLGDVENGEIGKLDTPGHGRQLGTRRRRSRMEAKVVVSLRPRCHTLILASSHGKAWAPCAGPHRKSGTIFM